MLSSFVHRAHRIQKVVNDLLLFPMFFVLLFELSHKELPLHHENLGDWLLTASFLLEWILGFYLSGNKKQYTLKITNLMDLISCLPFGIIVQSARLGRLVRVLKVFRFVSRVNRYKGPANDFIRLLGIVGATIFAGAYSIEVIEPEMLQGEDGKNRFLSGLWWAWVTISTVGYGDITPSTTEGRLVAAPLIGIGVGVCGYISAYMMRLMAHQEELETVSAVEHVTKEDIQRVERKLDRLASALEIKDWEESPYTKDHG